MGGRGLAPIIRVAEAPARRLAYAAAIAGTNPETNADAIEGVRKAHGVDADESRQLAAWAEGIAEADGVRERLDALEPVPGRILTLSIAGLAAFIGFTTCVIAQFERQVHVLFNPIAALIAWNLSVYALRIVSRLRPGRHRPSSPRAPLEPALATEDVGRRERVDLAEVRVPWRLRFLFRMERLMRRFDATRLEWGGRARDARAFRAQYVALCREPIHARARAAIAFAAASMAVGMVGSMYVQALFTNFSVIWESTFPVSADWWMLLARVVYFPALLLYGEHFPDQSAFAQMASPAGFPGATWIHIFGVSAGAFVVIPRAAMAMGALRRARRLEKAIEVDLAAEPWASVLQRIRRPVAAEPIPGAARRARRPADEPALIGALVLTEEAEALLLALMKELVREDIRCTKESSVLRDAIGPKQAWLARWEEQVVRAQASVGDDADGRILDLDSTRFQQLLDQIPTYVSPWAREAILLRLCCFQPYLDLSGAEGAEPMREPAGLVGRVLVSAKGATRSSTEWLTRHRLTRSGRKNGFEKAAATLGLEATAEDLLTSAVASANRGISGKRTRVVVSGLVLAASGSTAGLLAAPTIGAALAPGGLVGAAAAKAGLAALGGGTLAAGGAGVAGGTAVIVAGGGALSGLGGLAGAALTSGVALVEAARAEAYIRAIAWQRHRDRSAVEAALEDLRRSVGQRAEAIRKMKEDPTIPREMRVEANKAARIYKKVYRRNRKWWDKISAGS